jgi:small-conductance mechanosensitive channel
MFNVTFHHWWIDIVYFSQVSQTGKRIQQLLEQITAAKLTKAAFVLILASVGMKASERIVNQVSERIPQRYRLRVKQSLPVWRAIILVIASVTLLNLFVDFSSNSVFALTGSAAVAVGFAFKDYASSVIAGIVALFEAPYRVGDRIDIDGQYGEVVDYGFRGIRIKTLQDEIVTIPHNKLWTHTVANANNGRLEAQVVTDFYLAHGVDIQRVIDILTQAAYTSKYSQVSLPVVVSVEEKPWGTAFQLKSYVMDVREETSYKTDLIKRAKQAFYQAGFTYPGLPVQE